MTNKFRKDFSPNMHIRKLALTFHSGGKKIEMSIFSRINAQFSILISDMNDEKRLLSMWLFIFVNLINEFRILLFFIHNFTDF